MKRILIIEDDPDLRENIRDLLELENFEVITASNGKEGLETAGNFRPDLIVCDIMMPELDGYSVLEKLKKEHSTALIPLIFLTAKTEREEMRHGMELGADDYLTKPFSNEDLLKAIAARLEKQENYIKESQQQLEKLRDSISYSIPHELKTTLHGILGWSQILSSSVDNLETEEIKDIAEQIKAAGERLNELIDNILLYSQIEILASNPEKIKELQNNQVLSVKSVILERVNIIAKKAGRSEDIKYDLEDADIKISEVHLTKILQEIIGNALKFSEEGSLVTITTAKIKDNLNIVVADQGRGIREEELKKIGAYIQFGRKKYEQQGAGLGLVISQKIAELYRGKLEIESIPNQGTKVIINLPIATNKLEYV